MAGGSLVAGAEEPVSSAPALTVLIVDDPDDVAFFERIGFEVGRWAQHRRQFAALAARPQIAVLFADVLKACLDDSALLRHLARLDTPLLVLDGRAGAIAEPAPPLDVLLDRHDHKRLPIAALFAAAGQVPLLDPSLGGEGMSRPSPARSQTAERSPRIAA